MEPSEPAAPRRQRFHGAETSHHGARRLWVRCLPLLLAPLWGCSEEAGKAQAKTSMSTDLVALKRLIKLPADVSRCEWQTGKLAPHGGDWWVAAVLSVPGDQMSSFLHGPATQALFETPPGLQFTSSFAALKALPDAQAIAPDRIRVVIDTHDIEPYASSPLLNGKTIRLTATEVLVLLWTN